MNYLLLDNKKDTKRLSFIKIQLKNEIKIILSPSCRNLFLSWLIGCIVILVKTNSNDTIVCWYDFQAVLCYWLSKLIFKAEKDCLHQPFVERQGIHEKQSGGLAL